MRKPILLALAILFVFYSCTKIQSTDIGSGLIPPVDGVTTIDTSLLVITNTFSDDTAARVNKGDNHVIGIINDPLFGKTTASAFFEIKPTYYKFSFGGKKSDLKIDSVVLIMSYKGLYGDSGVAQSFSVYEINQNSKLKFDSSYKTTDIINTIGAPLNTPVNFDLRKLGDSVPLDPRFESAKSQVRIKLDPTFADRLKNYDTTGSASGNSAYDSDSLFRTYFAGFAVVPNTAGGQALIKINFLDTNTKLSVYYSRLATGSTTRDTLVYSFRFNTTGDNTTSGSANIIKRERTATNKVNSFLGTSPANDSLVFLQTSPGTFVRVRIPGLSSLPNAIIHKAELVMDQVPDVYLTDIAQAPPRYVMLTAYDSVNKIKLTIPNDYVIDASGSANIDQFGGFLSYRTMAGFTNPVATYSFNLTRYVQGIVTRGDPSYTLRLYAPATDSVKYSPPYPAIGPVTSFIYPTSANEIADGRVMLRGGGGSLTHPLRMRLRIIYSRL